MFYAIRKFYHPEFYQGPTGLAPYFEGWYYKAVIEGSAFAVIPGVSRSPEDPHAFVQFMDGTSGSSSYNRYNLDEFSFRRDRFEVQIGPNRFSRESYHVDLPDLTCDLETSLVHGWPSSLFSPGTMGPYSFVPFMECRHGIIIMDAGLTGTLNGAAVANGRLYVEKDYGRSFPSAWVWLQTNSVLAGGHAETGVSVTCSIATVPFVGGAFTGFLAAILHEGTLHRFTTYTGARLAQLDIDDKVVTIRLEDRRTSLDIVAHREGGAVLLSPAEGAMTGRISESLASVVETTLTVDGTVVFTGTGTKAGLEVVNPGGLRRK